MLNYNVLPEGLRGGMQYYIEYGIPPGSFLQAVLSNDLVEAVGAADNNNVHLLVQICSFLYNELPRRGNGDQSPWGSKEIMLAYAERVHAEYQKNLEKDEVS